MKKTVVTLAVALFASMASANLSCGIPPIPPIGCKTGPCVCDRNGQNCDWTFFCS